MNTIQQKETNFQEIIESRVLTLQGIFNVIRRSAMLLEGEADGDLEAFCYDLINLSNTGFDLASFIWRETLEQTPETLEQPKTKSIAEMIHFLIKSDAIPVEISNALAQAVSDVQADVMNDYEQTPEYIALILENFQTNGGQTN